jgi:hypothetical protein
MGRLRIAGAMGFSVVSMVVVSSQVKRNQTLVHRNGLQEIVIMDEVGRPKLPADGAHDCPG